MSTNASSAGSEEYGMDDLQEGDEFAEQQDEMDDVIFDLNGKESDDEPQTQEENSLSQPQSQLAQAKVVSGSPQDEDSHME